jgi:hypothetical protein
MKRAFHFGLAFVLCLSAKSLLAAPALDVPLPGGYLDLQYTAGSGANSAYFIVDFGDNGGQTYAFKYQWPAATQQTPVQALYSIINSTGPLGSLQMATGPTIPVSGPDPQTNYFVNGFAYNSNSDTPNPATKSWFLFLGDYATSNVTWGDPDDVFFGISGIDFGGNMIYTLENNKFYGFHVGGFDQNFMILSDNPRLPVAVPEPAACVLAAAGGLGLFVLQRRRRAGACQRLVPSSPRQIS